MQRGSAAWSWVWDSNATKFALIDVRGVTTEDVLDIECSVRAQLDQLGFTDVRCVRVYQDPTPLSICGGLGYDVSECVFVAGPQPDTVMASLMHGTFVHRLY